MVKILSGPALVGHLFRDRDEAILRAVPVFVDVFAKLTDLDVHPSEVQIVDCYMGSNEWTEVRSAHRIIASWREVSGREVSA